jgi:hypothetical protein
VSARVVIHGVLGSERWHCYHDRAARRYPTHNGVDLHGAVFCQVVCVSSPTAINYALALVVSDFDSDVELEGGGQLACQMIERV